MKKIIFFITLLFIQLSLTGQYWEIIYDSVHTMGREVSLTNDSCYIVTATNSSSDHGISLKISQYGEIFWVSPYGGSSIEQTYDSGYIIAGANGYEYALLTKLDRYGNYAWEKEYGNYVQHDFHSVIQTSDSCFLAVGFSQKVSDSGIYILKTDFNGNILWSKRLYSDYLGLARKVIEFDNQYYIVGNFRDYYNNYSLFLAKLNANGSYCWQKTYKIGRTGNSFAFTKDTSIIVVGSNIITKLNIEGDTLWSKTMDPYWDFYSVDITSDNGYILSGCRHIYLFMDKNFIARLDSYGNVIWTKDYSVGIHSFVSVFESIKNIANDGFITCGYSEIESSTKLRIIKSDSLGNIIVNAENYSLSNNKFSVYPNPFTTSTTIEYELKQHEFVTISIFNHLGEQVELIQKQQPAGMQKVIWNADGLPAGIYYFSVHAGKQIANGKLMLVRQ